MFRQAEGQPQPQAGLVSSGSGDPAALLNLASRKFCSGFQKDVAPNSRLVAGTVRRCAMWGQAPLAQQQMAA